VTPYEANWESLARYEAPDWFRDAKFGVFIHWGPPSVSFGHGGWPARHLYMQEGADWGNDYELHNEQFGHPSEFGYKDLIPLWNAENWDPDDIISIFKTAGVRYIVPVAVHHDNFDLYDSSHQPWNSVNMGPKRDIIGEWARAARKQGLKFGVSSHVDRAWYWFQPARGTDVRGPLMGVPYDGQLTLEDGAGKWWEGYDPQQLYAGGLNNTYFNDKEYMLKGVTPGDDYRENWRLRTLELIDNYQPDLIWFDGPMPMVLHEQATDEEKARFGAAGLEVAAHFYNKQMEWHGHQNGVLNIKSWGQGTVPDTGAVVLDIEKGSVDRLMEHPWQSETSITGEWFYNGIEDPEMTAGVIIHMLVDVVSKNGNLLLNIAPKSDGTLAGYELDILQDIGRWLDQNGEAIYGTRPWTLYGEGPTTIISGDFQQITEPMTHEDIRFTTRGPVLYAIMNGWPEDGVARIGSLKGYDFSRVTILGDGVELTSSTTDRGLAIQLPGSAPGSFAYVLKFEQ
jgi:alpha-L-fucosidase